MELLGQRICAFFKIYFKNFDKFCSPRQLYHIKLHQLRKYFLASLSMLCFKLFDLCQPDNYKLCLIIVLVYSYLISNESGHLLCVGKPLAFLSLWATCS